ncbi:MAG: hypothetical protein AB7L13_18280 [Acidimicrobiia bacterium]
MTPRPRSRGWPYPDDEPFWKNRGGMPPCAGQARARARRGCIVAVAVAMVVFLLLGVLGALSSAR